MKRSLLLTLMAIAGTAILAVALVGFRLSQGGLDYSAFAHIYDYDANTTNDFHAEVDADATNGTAPCAPVDATASVYPGIHEVAVCTTSAAANLGALAFVLNYDPALNTCTDVNCAAGDCLDDNPDANAGLTLGSGVPTSPDLGTGWDCNIMDLAQPTCAKDAVAGAAWIGCWSLTGPYTSPIGDVSFPLAVVTFNAVALGTDALSLSTVILGDSAGGEIGSCNPVSSVGINCEGASLDKVPVPSPTPLPPSADVAVTLADDVDPVMVGNNVTYTAVVTNEEVTAVEWIPAADVELVVTLPPAKAYVSDDCGCTEAAGVVTCAIGTLGINVGVDDSKTCNIVATALAVGTHTTTAAVTTTTSDANAANNSDSETTAEVSSGVRMEKDCDVLTPDVQTECNLWVMADGCTVAEEGKGCLKIEKWVFNAIDTDSTNDLDEVPEGLGAWEERIAFDHKILDVSAVPDNTWLESGGRIAHCEFTLVTENYILIGCVSKDDPEVDGQQPGPMGDGLIEVITINPRTSDLIYRDLFRPTKDNGIVTDIIDENCEVTDTLAEWIPGTSPGGLTATCGDVHITVRMLQGDLDLDCDVDVVDDQAIAFRYGAAFGLQLYDAWFDLEPKYTDADIDIKDLQFVFGRNYSTCQAPIPDDQGLPATLPIDP